MLIHIGIFAHNEQDRIGATVQDLARQDLFARPDVAVRVFVLANGCKDGTVAAARDAIAGLPPDVAACFSVLDLPLGGKSRTWNHFVHDLSAGTDFIYCVDGDIRIPQADNLTRMLACMDDPELWVVNSRPRKDLEVTPGAARSPVERAIVMASGTNSDYRNSIAGSLYLARRPAIDGIHMPVGLPVEDGFLRAMVLTRLLTEPEDFRRIHGQPEIWHIYESLRTIPALVRHQTRLVIGSAINTAIFDHLRAHEGYETRRALLADAARDEDWLGNMLGAALPRWPSGFVPVHFLVNRLESLRHRREVGLARKMVLGTVGFALDALVYVNAQWQMARGKGAGHW